jgi:excisionase family DNA binding protein
MPPLQDAPAPTLVLYTAAEVAEVLRLNPQVVQRKLQAGEIPGYRIGREWRVEHSKLVEWLEGHSNQRSDDDKLLANWFDRDGRLRALPVQRKKRDVVLRRLAERFATDRTYSEREMNAELTTVHDDVAMLRRELIMTGLFVRTPHGVYKRVGRGQPALRR